MVRPNGFTMLTVAHFIRRKLSPRRTYRTVKNHACRHYHSLAPKTTYAQYHYSVDIECQYHHPSDGYKRLRRDSNRVKTHRCVYYHDNPFIATGINACGSDNDHRACHDCTGYYR